MSDARNYAILSLIYAFRHYIDDRESILDIKAQDEGGTWYDIEMQIESHPLYGRRAIYYAARTYAGQIKRGDEFTQLNTTIGIHFLDFTYFKDDRLLRQFVFKDADTNEASAALSGIRLHFVEMSKFDKEWPEIRTTLDRWIVLLNKAREMDRAAMTAQLSTEPALVKAVAALDRMGLDEREQDIYDREVTKHMADIYQINSARGEGRQEDMQQGLKQLVQQQITRRFGSIPMAIAGKLGSLSTDALRAFGNDLLDFNSQADVERWLANNEPTRPN